MRRRLVTGMLAGWALWGVLFTIGYPYVTGARIFPEVLRDSEAFAHIAHAAAIAALPIAWGGWLFIWGDGPGQPPSWATTMWFTVVFGLVLYGALCVAAAAIYGKLRAKSTTD